MATHHENIALSEIQAPRINRLEESISVHQALAEGPAPIVQPTANEAIVGYNQQLALTTPSATRQFLTSWKLALVVVPTLFFILNIAMFAFSIVALDFITDVPNGHRLTEVYSYPRGVNLAMNCLTGLGVFNSLYQFVTNAIKPLRPYYKYGFLSGCYYVYLIYDVCMISTYASIKKNIKPEFRGYEVFNISLNLLIAVLVVLVIYMCIPNNPMTRQRRASAPPRSPSSNNVEIDSGIAQLGTEAGSRSTLRLSPEPTDDNGSVQVASNELDDGRRRSDLSYLPGTSDEISTASPRAPPVPPRDPRRTSRYTSFPPASRATSGFSSRGSGRRQSRTPRTPASRRSVNSSINDGSLAITDSPIIVSNYRRETTDTDRIFDGPRAGVTQGSTAGRAFTRAAVPGDILVVGNSDENAPARFEVADSMPATYWESGPRRTKNHEHLFRSVSR